MGYVQSGLMDGLNVGAAGAKAVRPKAANVNPIRGLISSWIFEGRLKKMLQLTFHRRIHGTLIYLRSKILKMGSRTATREKLLTE